MWLLALALPAAVPGEVSPSVQESPRPQPMRPQLLGATVYPASTGTSRAFSRLILTLLRGRQSRDPRFTDEDTEVLRGEPSVPKSHSGKSESRSVVSDSLRPHGLYSPWKSPGQNTGVGSLSLLQGIFLIQGSNLGFPYWRQTVYHLNHQHLSQSISSVAQSCPTLCDPMNRSTPGLPVHHQLPEFTQTYVHRVRDAIQPSHPRSSPSPPAPNPSQHQSLFQSVNSSHEVTKVLELQL